MGWLDNTIAGIPRRGLVRGHINEIATVPAHTFTVRVGTMSVVVQFRVLSSLVHHCPGFWSRPRTTPTLRTIEVPGTMAEEMEASLTNLCSIISGDLGCGPPSGNRATMNASARPCSQGTRQANGNDSMVKVMPPSAKAGR